MRARARWIAPFTLLVAACGSTDKTADHPASTSGADGVPDLHVGDPLANENDASSGPAFGSGPSLRADRTEKPPNIDGVLGSEWPKDMTKLAVAVRGPSGGKDLQAQVALLYDDKNFYLGADVIDDVLRGGADRVDLVIASSGAPETFALYPGQPGKTAAKALKGGRPIPGARIVEAANTNGWSLEAAIPWTQIGDGRTRVGLKGAVFVQDADASDAIEATIGTTESADLASLPPLLTTPELALAEGLVKDKRLGSPQFSFTDDVAGNAEKERVLVFDKYLVVLGSAFHGGTDYYFSDMSTAGTTLSVLSCELRDVDGDGKKDIVLKKRFTEKGGISRDVLDIESFGQADAPTAIFRHEIGITTPKGSIANDVTFVPEGGHVSIRFASGTAKGLTRETFDQGIETSFDPVLLPWDTDAATYKISGTTFTVASTTKHKGSEGATSVPPTEAMPASHPTPQATKPDIEKVYASYKTVGGESGTPRFDLSGDVDDDTTPERVLLQDKDLVVFGPGFKNGLGYAYTTLAFDKPEDIESVTLKSVTGDSKASVVVRGILRSKAPKDAGGGDVEREIELVYRVQNEALKRVFGAEVSRALGSNKIVASLSYSGGKAVLAPGKAIGFTRDTYPFNQDTGPVGGIEPLPLPWGDAKATTYTWDGSAFSK